MCVKVPVELKISPRTVGMNHNTSSSPAGCTVYIPFQSPASAGYLHERAVDISHLSRDAMEEGQGRKCHTINDAPETIVSRTSTASKITLSVPHTKDEQKYTAISPNVTLNLNPNSLSTDELLSFETLTASRQRSFSTKQTPSSDVDTEHLSDSDNSADVWVPRTPSAAEAVSGIWIVCPQTPTAAARPPALRRINRSHKLRAELESPDPVFRRRVTGSVAYPTQCCSASALSIGGTPLETVDSRLTAREKRRAWRKAAVQHRMQRMDSYLPTQQEYTSVLSQTAAFQRSAAALTYSGNLSDVDVYDDGQRSPVVQVMVDGGPRAEANIDESEERHQRTKESRNIELPLHLPVSALTTTTAALASSLRERLVSLRRGRSTDHDDRHKQQKLIENRARKALRTISIMSSALPPCASCTNYDNHVKIIFHWSALHSHDRSTSFRDVMLTFAPVIEF